MRESLGEGVTGYILPNTSCLGKRGVLGQEGEGEGRGDKSRTYRMTFLTEAGPRHYPVEGCSGRVATQTDMRVHFWHQHVWESLVILGRATSSTHGDPYAIYW